MSVASNNAIHLESLRKTFSGGFALDVGSLSIRTGEVFCLIGPSGSGKSSLLGIVGGWVTPDEGKVILLGADSTTLTPNRRPIRACFQKGGYLFPHLTAGQNVEFPLRATGVDKQARKRLVEEGLRRVGLPGFENRSIASLSGGEAQRVSIARALANPAPVLLLDEITTGLDGHLRGRILDLVEEEISRLQLTVVCVTHSLDEAFRLCHRFQSRMGVMLDGRLVQVDLPQGIYDRPNTATIASLTGRANLLPIKSAGDDHVIIGEKVRIAVPAHVAEASCLFSRPEHVVLNPTDTARYLALPATFVSSTPMGASVLGVAQVEGCPVEIILSVGTDVPQPGQACVVGLDMNHLSGF